MNTYLEKELIDSIKEVHNLIDNYNSVLLFGDFNLKIKWEDVPFPIDTLANDFLSCFNKLFSIKV
jgi:hypothetical protein